MKPFKLNIICIDKKKFPSDVYSNMMNSINLSNRMNAIFMNFKNSKTSDPHNLLLTLTDKVNLERSDRYVALSNPIIYYTWKNIEKSYKNNKFKISSNMEWRARITWWLIFCVRYSRLFWVYHQKNKINKIENRITFKINIGFYLELLTPETMKLLGNNSWI